MLTLTCPHCRSFLTRREQDAGLTIACPSCGNFLQVPLPRDKTILGEIQPDFNKTMLGEIQPRFDQTLVGEIQLASSATSQPTASPIPLNKTVLGQLQQVSIPPNSQAAGTYPLPSQPSAGLTVDYCLLLALFGSALLLVGVFAPLISVPIVGTINYVLNGRGDGIIVLVLAAISAFLSIARAYRGLWVTGLGSLAIMAG